MDLPGGTIEFCERPEDALKRELIEEVEIKVKDYKRFDADSIQSVWQFKENVFVKVHHTRIFYQVFNYDQKIKQHVKIDEVNDDSLGAEFYEIKDLTKDRLSAIAILELEKLGYEIN